MLLSKVEDLWFCGPISLQKKNHKLWTQSDPSPLWDYDNLMYFHVSLTVAPSVPEIWGPFFWFCFTWMCSEFACDWLILCLGVCVCEHVSFVTQSVRRALLVEMKRRLWRLMDIVTKTDLWGGTVALHEVQFAWMCKCFFHFTRTFIYN